MIEHPKTTGQSPVESESSEEVDSLVKERHCKIFSLLSLHVNKHPLLTTLRKLVTGEGDGWLTEENEHQNE